MTMLSSRFRPVSAEDFARYARNLAWVLREPLQRAQELLAQIYGYADTHELHSVMGSPGVPGPFDDDGAAAENGRVDMELFSVQMRRRSDRANRTWRILSSAFVANKDGDLERYREALSLGLFCQPSEHRQRVAAYKAKLSATAGTLERGALMSDYVVADVRDDGEVWAAFTPKGGAVFSAITDRLSRDEISEQDLDRAEAYVLKLADEHPANPWPYAMYVTHFAARYDQSTWDEYATEDCIDGPPGIADQAAKFAMHHLPLVKRNVEQMESLFGTDAPIPDPNILSGRYPNGYDARSYPGMLYWGGRIAQNAGDTRTAAKWYRRLIARVGRDPYGARFQLAELRLAAGRGAVRKLFTYDGEVQTTSPVAALACAAESFVKGNPAQGRADFADGLEWSWSLLEAFGPKVESRQRLFRRMDGHGPAMVREFLFRTQEFWNRNPDAVQFFAEICRRPSVRRVVVELHEYDADRKRTEGSGPNDFALYPQLRARQVQAIRSAVMEGA